MDKVVILVSANFLKLRIEKLIPEYESVRIDFNGFKNFRGQQINNILNDVVFVIIDLDKDEEDCINIIREIRKSKNRKQVPIIALGNSGEVSVISSAVISGCNDFILKPFDDETFVKRVALQLESVQGAIKSTSKSEEPNREQHDIPEWSSDYKIGVESIDNEHRMIIESFAKLYTLMKVGHGHEYYQEMLLFLKNYVDFHFQNEEAFQVEMDYPHLVDHQKDHENYKQKISELYDDQKNRLPRDEDLIALNLLIKKFLKEHILEEDKKIGEFVKTKDGEVVNKNK